MLNYKRKNLLRFFNRLYVQNADKNFGIVDDVSYSENVIVMLNLSVSRASHVNALPVRTEETGLFGAQLSIDIL